MHLAPEDEIRRNLLPKWVRFFAWFFLAAGTAMPALLVSGIFYPNPMQFSLFGWEHQGSPFDAYSLLVVAYFAASGVAAFGMLWGRRWGWAAGFLVGCVGLLLALGSMFVQPLVQEGNGKYSVYIRLEPLFQIAFLYVLWRIRRSWLSSPAAAASAGRARGTVASVVGALTAVTSALVFIAAALLSAMTSGMIDVAGRFFEAVKANDVARARGYLSSEAQAATDEDTLRQFLAQSGAFEFRSANWPVRQALGRRGELKGTIATASGEVPMALTFAKEGGQWKIYHLSRPAAAPKPQDLDSLRRRAESGDVHAQTELGERYFAGDGVAKDGTEAEKWLRLAADQGYAGAQYDLAVMYDEGQGVAADKAQALDWYLKAARQGFSKAQYNLGFNYAHGDGVEKNDVEAANWYRKSAEQGYANAQLNLGTMYADGLGVAKDDAEALAWFRKAAAQGIAKAQFDMGQAYAHGRGVQQDDKAAVAWYRQAADQGLASAQDELAAAYSTGKGIPKSTKEAYFWSLLGARGDERKQDQLGEARAPLAPEEITEVEARAARWRPTSARTAN